MCGVAGTVGLDDRALAAVDAMCRQMHARGPDDNGVEVLDGAVLGSTRLSIIDPSPSGHQPMLDPDRGTALVYNGMLYNFRELRQELSALGELFRSDCDTEVVLRAYGRWGERCVERFRGMFAFAIWDNRKRRLFLARDRLGIKPLYYAETPTGLVFASQVKALLTGGLVAKRLSASALETYLAFGAVSEPQTAIDGVSALSAGHTAVFENGALSTSRYWHPKPEPHDDGDRDEAHVLHELLADSVNEHMVSDAPLGVFLSGGLDSSLLAALAAQSTPHVRTVSVEFDQPESAENRYARMVAERIGSDHVTVPFSAAELIATLPEAFDAMDQPSFDGINTYIVSRAAAQTGLKVAISGLGADELFDGYGYFRRVALLERARKLPRPLLRTLPAVGRLLPMRPDKLAYWSRSRTYPGGAYGLLRTLFLPPDVKSLTRANGSLTPASPSLFYPAADLYGQITALDLGHYTQNVLLRDTDAMSMANSLEVRVPYLDHRLVEHALRLPSHVKGHRKQLLARAADGLLPDKILTRPKHGFLVPFERWLRRELVAEVEATLAAPPAALDDVIDAGAARRVWADYRDGRGTWLRPWSLYALAKWTESLP